MIREKLLTIFTPAYNRLHTIKRTYESICNQSSKDVNWLVIDDGSEDGLIDWVKSLGRMVSSKGVSFDWMGTPTGEISENHFIIETDTITIEYVYKPNGGLYTGYNVAFSVIKTELCVCIDSDDFLPDNAVEMIANTWNGFSEIERKQIGGIAGLDFNVVDKKPIGGVFNTNEKTACVLELKHKGDCKFVFRTELIRQFAPQIGFKGEKDFNPHYMQMQLLDDFPLIILNDNLCWVEYQYGADSMSQAIFKQYVRSPKSYAKYRLLEMELKHANGFLNKLRLNAHYVSACMFAKDKTWFKKSPQKLITLLSIPIALPLNIYIRYKAK